MPEKIIKSFPIEITKVNKEQGIIEAIVSVMGNIDHGDDIIHLGAFTKTISERGNKVLILDYHRLESNRDVIGKALSLREIGREELPDDVKQNYPDATGGLYIVAQFDMDDENSKAIFNKLANKYVTEWSIGFSIPKSKSDYQIVKTSTGEKTVRNIREVILYECSPVAMGANSATTTVLAKSLDEIKKISLMETYWNVTDAFNTVYCMMDDDHNYFGYMATDVFDNNSMLCRAINIETDFKYYQLNYFVNGDNTYRFDEMSDWIGGNYSFVIGSKETELDLENKAGRVLSQSNFDKISKAHMLLMEVVESAKQPETEETMNIETDLENKSDEIENTDDLAKSQEALTKQRDEILSEIIHLINYADNLGVH